MYGVVIALLPALLVSFLYFGLGSAIVCATSVAACVVFEWAINKFLLKNDRVTVCDGSAVVTGMIIPLLMPASARLETIAIAVVFAMVVAKHPHAQEVLKNQLHTPDFRRVYLAVCEGVPAPTAGWVDAPLGPRPGSLVEQMVRPDGKEARTHYEVLEIHGPRALLRLELDTGRTHQIRVHMAHLGHPILGDTVYGAKKPVPGLQGQCLHAVGLRFRHPRTGELVELSCGLPEEFEAQLKKHTLS